MSESEEEMMTADLRAFVEAHPEGWNHDEWLGLLADLEGRGVDVSTQDAIGAELEKTRLAWELSRREVPGLGPKRIEAISKRFGTIWKLRGATLDEVARVPSMNRALAEKLLSSLA